MLYWGLGKLLFEQQQLVDGNQQDDNQAFGSWLKNNIKTKSILPQIDAAVL